MREKKGKIGRKMRKGFHGKQTKEYSWKKNILNGAGYSLCCYEPHIYILLFKGQLLLASLQKIINKANYCLILIYVLHKVNPQDDDFKESLASKNMNIYS